MKESSYFRSNATIHIIYKCIKNTRFPALRNNITVSYCCRYQCTITLFQ